MPFVYLSLFGLERGEVLVTTSIALVSAVKRENQAVIRSTTFVFGATGLAIGWTLASATFRNVLCLNLRKYLGRTGGAEAIVHRIKDNFGELKHLDLRILISVQNSNTSALRIACLTVHGFSVCQHFSVCSYARTHFIVA